MANHSESPQSLIDSLEASLKSAPWLTPADQVTIAWAAFLAKSLDSGLDPADAARFGKLFETATRDLGLSIAGRATKPQEPVTEVNPLDALRNPQPVKKAAPRKSTSKSKNEKQTGKRATVRTTKRTR